ncbi:uncharacterized protein LOC141601975 [Silene latifolia]|uniref:uncharacterized protein LOC141601975 n=1 Tax=Silene latifolia TaxID=37657 RepID=UPI003D7806EB
MSILLFKRLISYRQKRQEREGKRFSLKKRTDNVSNVFSKLQDEEREKVESIDDEIATARAEVDGVVQKATDTVLKEGLVLSEDPKDWCSSRPPASSVSPTLEPIPEVACEDGECSSPVLKLSMDDVKDEIEFWKLAVYGYVMGANPPWDVLDNFLRRIWAAYEISQISFLPNGLFVVGFAKAEHHKLVLENVMFIFDGKPLIIKPWDPPVKISKISVKKVPIWIKLVGLDLKFWGAKCLEKISGLLGHFVRIDDSTLEKSLLGFARIMVEVEIDQKIPSQIMFVDELGKEVRVDVEYDWLPITCQKCNGIGHTTADCRRAELRRRRFQKPPVKQVWKPKFGGSGPSVDPKEFPPLGPSQVPVHSAGLGKSVGPVLATPLVTPIPNPGPIFTPARVITRMTRHETRVVHAQDGPFTAHFNAELAEVADTTELVDKDIKWFLHQNDVDLFALLETRVKPVSLNRIANNVCYNWNYITNTSMHNGGRIWVLWRDSRIKLDVIEMEAQYIHAKIKVKHTDQEFTATFIYGFNKIEERVPLWNALVRLTVNGPWIVLGDFNNVMFANERLGKIVRDDEMLPFHSTVSICDLHDLKTTGAFFTWNNKQPSETRVFSRIDRVLVNGDWLTQWPDWYAHFQPEGTFNHCPCIIAHGNCVGGKRKPFKFYNMWTKVKDFDILVKEHWHIYVTGSPMFRVARKLKLLKPALRGLNRELFSDIERNAVIAFHLLTDCQLQLQSDPMNTSLMDKERGQRILPTLHNKVMKIQNAEGVECIEPDAILQAFLVYYEDLLGTKAQTSDFYPHVVINGPRVNENDWDNMCSIPSDEDIRQAVFSIPIEKSSGPDGYTSDFFQS